MKEIENETNNTSTNDSPEYSTPNISVIHHQNKTNESSLNNSINVANGIYTSASNGPSAAYSTN